MMATKTTFQTVLDEFSQSMISDTRDDGTTFYKIKDDAPEWLQGSDVSMACHKALDDRFPDDWVYEQMYFIADNLSSYEDADSARDAMGEIADSLVDVYNAARSKWLASHLNNALLCDEAADDFGGDVDTFQRIGQGQYLATERIGCALIGCIEDEADTREEDEDD